MLLQIRGTRVLYIFTFVPSHCSGLCANVKSPESPPWPSYLMITEPTAPNPLLISIGDLFKLLLNENRILLLSLSITHSPVARTVPDTQYIFVEWMILTNSNCSQWTMFTLFIEEWTSAIFFSHFMVNISRLFCHLWTCWTAARHTRAFVVCAYVLLDVDKNILQMGILEGMV